MHIEAMFKDYESYWCKVYSGKDYEIRLLDKCVQDEMNKSGIKCTKIRTKDSYIAIENGKVINEY